MLGLGFGWEITWMLLADGRVLKRTAFASQLQGQSHDRASGQLSASYEDEEVPWGEVPPEIQEGFRSRRHRQLASGRRARAKAKDGGS